MTILIRLQGCGEVYRALHKGLTKQTQASGRLYTRISNCGIAKYSGANTALFWEVER